MLLLLGLVAQILIQARMHVKPLGCTGGDVHYAVFQRQNCAHACSVCSLTIAQPGRNMADAKAEEAFSSNHGNKKLPLPDAQAGTRDLTSLPTRERLFSEVEEQQASTGAGMARWNLS